MQGKKFIPGRVRLNAQTTASLKDYYYLTIILGAGFLLTLAISLAAVQIQYHSRHKDFEVESKLIENSLDLAFSNQVFRVQNLETELHYSGEDFHQIFPRLSSLLRKTAFSRLAFLRLDPKARVTTDWRYSTDAGPLLEPFDASTLQILEQIIGRLQSSPVSYSTVFLVGPRGADLVLVWKYLSSDREYLIAFSEASQFFQGLQTKDLDLVLEQDRFGKPDFFQIGRRNDGSVRELSEANFTTQLAAARFHVSNPIPALGDEIRLHVLKVSGLGDLMAWPVTMLLGGAAITLLVGFLVFNLINRNIEVRKLVEKRTRDLETESRRAREAAMAKTRFLANVSHEVRTPLNLILGMADLLRETPLSEQQARYVENFSRAGNHLLRLIGDILDMARLDSDEIKVFPDRVFLLRYFEEMMEFVAPSCEIKGLSLQFYMDPRLPAEGILDPSRVRQIVLNLLNNSLKFTDKGSITVTVREQLEVKGLESERGIVISVRDTGIGIPADQVQNVFREFYQVDSSATRSRGGTGLGLAIVRALVTRLNGRLQVRSELRVGTEIAVFLPIEFASAQTVSDLITWGQKPEQVALINLEGVMRPAFGALVDLGIEVSAMTWESLASVSPEHFRSMAAVFVEIPSRPIEDWGQRLSRVSPQTPLVLLKPSQMDEASVAVGVGSRTYAELDVPVLFSHLVGVLSGYVRGRKRTAEGATQRPTNYVIAAGFKVLIVEDDSDNRILLEAYMAQLDIHYQFATNGKEALELIRKAPPTLLVTDLQMPVMDGFALIEHLRRLEGAGDLKPFPIIVLTADAQEETMQMARHLKVNQILTKPVRKREFIEALMDFAESGRSALSHPPPPPEATL